MFTDSVDELFTEKGTACEFRISRICPAHSVPRHKFNFWRPALQIQIVNADNSVLFLNIPCYYMPFKYTKSKTSF